MRKGDFNNVYPNIYIREINGKKQLSLFIKKTAIRTHTF